MEAIISNIAVEGSNLNLQSANVFQLVMAQFLTHFNFFLKINLLIILVWVTHGAQTVNGIFKQARILPTYLFVKPAQGGLPQ